MKLDMITINQSTSLYSIQYITSLPRVPLPTMSIYNLC